MAMGVTTLLRVSLLVATCVVWVIAQQDEDPVIPEWLFASGEDDEDATNIITTRKPNLGWVRGGTSCLNSEECGRGKCCLRRYKSPRRRCRRFQRIGELCTEEQMMGGYYYGHCPCNKHGVCTYVGDVMRCVPKKQERPPETPPPQVPTPPPALPPKERPGQKPDSQESEEATAKPGGQVKPTGGTTENELPELPFETLTGPVDGSNVIPPLTSQGGGSRFPGSSNRPSSSAAVDSPNSIPMPAPTTNTAGRFGQVGNTIPSVSTAPHLGGAGTPGQLPSAPPVAPPAQSPNTHSASFPPTPTQGASRPAPLPLPTSTGNNVSLRPGGPQNSLLPPTMNSENNRFPPIPNQVPQPPGLPPSLPPNVNHPLPPSPEQKPPQLNQPPQPTETGSNDFPPIAEDGPAPPPLPPSPIDVLNGRASLSAQQ